MPLIDLYDNVLIYNPNIFFPVIISVGILILILIINLAFLLGKKITIVPKEINNNLRKIKRIKLQKVYRIRLSPTKLMINIIKSIIKFTTQKIFVYKLLYVSNWT